MTALIIVEGSSHPNPFPCNYDGPDYSGMSDK